MTRTNNSKDYALKNSNEGTSARTRPVSLEEILSKRKMKLVIEIKEGDDEMRELSEEDNKGVSSDRGLNSKDTTKDTRGVVKGDSKRLKKETSKKERLEESTYKKERLKEAISKMEEDHYESKDKGDRYSETKAKVKSSYNKSTRERESKNEKHTHHRSRTSHRTGADSEKESEKKSVKNSKEKDKHEERGEKTGKEGKRKHESHIDDKNRSVVAGSISKKHGSGKLHDAEYLERTERKKEHSRTHHEEPRVKRRRSTSREHDRGRDRSASISPRAHRHSNHGREYDDAIVQTSKEKPRRKYSDAGDMYKTSGNGGHDSGHYRKHGSGLGGYSPRKRRTESAVKTPSPTKRSPEKKNSTWDQPPAGTNHGGFESIFTNLQLPASKILDSTSSTAVKPSVTKPQPPLALDRTSILMKASIESVQLTQATRPMRRLYIENLPPSTSEKSVIDCLNDFLLSSGINRIQGAKPCINCIINKEKCQAVVEFLTPEDATSAFSFDGISLSGSVLKIRRPKDFVEAAGIFIGCVIIPIQDRDKAGTL